MEVNSPYVFTLRDRGFLQVVRVIAIGNKAVKYDIEIEEEDTLLMKHNLPHHIVGVAKWIGCYGGVTEDGKLHPDSWEYLSPDGLLTIVLHGEFVTHAEMRVAPVKVTPIPRDGYTEE
jgi:hypothetical protein